MYISRIRSACLFPFFGVAIGFALSSGLAADTEINPSLYPPEALKLTDALIPKLAESLKTCNAEQARAVHAQVNDFIYKQWNWTANFTQLKSFRACFQMLSDIAATTQLITNKSLDVRPRMVAGLFDANYASCRKLVEPGYSTNTTGNMTWPNRFGPEPPKKHCG